MCILFIVVPCILKSIQFTHQQIYYFYLLNLEEFKIYTKIHTNIAPTCFGLRPSSGSLQLNLAKVILEHSVQLRRYMLFGDVAACHRMTCVLCAAHNTHIVL